MPEQAQILTPWTLTGGANAPQLPTDHPVLAWQDETGQPAIYLPVTPDLYAIQVTADTAVLDTIAADPTYHILWRQEIIENEPE